MASSSSASSMSSTTTFHKAYNLYHKLSQNQYDTLCLLLLLIFDSSLSLVILYKIPYTEIDWIAYMEEVTTWQNGEYNYVNIRGGTGPLVYPAGFLYLFGVLKWIAGANGKFAGNIFHVQTVFYGIYCINAFVVLKIYTIIVQCQRQRLMEKLPSNGEHQQQQKQSKISNTVWSWRFSMLLLCLSKRIHSIYILRLFNDGPCMLLFYISVYFFMKSSDAKSTMSYHNSFRMGCIFFSLAVSIKMNILLFAPGLLLLLLQYHDNLWKTVECLTICAVVQLVLGAPFLATYPVSYIRKAFEFDRVFFFKWTVNWKVSTTSVKSFLSTVDYPSITLITSCRCNHKFLHEDIFTSKPLSILLLAFHILTLIFFARKWIQTSRRRHSNKSIFLGPSKHLRPIYIFYTLSISNFIGIVFARTLHYQFYSWYFHTMPFMLWMTDLPFLTKVAVVGLIEYSFNVFPATVMSSAVLQFAHYVTLISLWKARLPMIVSKDDEEQKKKV